MGKVKTGKIKALVISVVCVVLVLVALITFVGIKVGSNPQAETIITAITKTKPSLNIYDLKEEKGDFDDYIQVDILCNSDYESVKYTVTIYDDDGEVYSQKSYTATDLKKGETFEHKILLTQFESLMVYEFGVKLDTYK